MRLPFPALFNHKNQSFILVVEVVDLDLDLVDGSIFRTFLIGFDYFFLRLDNLIQLLYFVSES